MCLNEIISKEDYVKKCNALDDEIRVYNDRFEWKFKIFNDKVTINTGVDANKDASIITDNFPSYWDSSTGCYC